MKTQSITTPPQYLAAADKVTPAQHRTYLRAKGKKVPVRTELTIATVIPPQSAFDKKLAAIFGC